MKTLILLIFSAVSIITSAQKIIKLDIKQPPEFGFSVSNQDTTIEKGSTLLLGTDLIVFGGSGVYEYDWSPAATLNDSTLVNPSATPNDTTVYILIVKDTFGCSFSLNYKVNVREKMVNSETVLNPEKLQAVLFPNPNDGRFKVKLLGIPSKKIDVSIIDISGKVIKKKIIRNFSGEFIETFQIQLVSGMYNLLIESDYETLNRQFIIN